MNQYENIRKNAELVVKVFAENDGVELDFDESSVEWLDGYIERNRENFDEETVRGLVNVLGSFLGECICRNYGGNWSQDENGLTVKFDELNGVYPFNKIEKHFINGAEDSILSFYQTIPVVFGLNK